ncbi:MAG: DUF2461 domain-containing protein [Chitinophagales bacterium]|nr:DUF2461 domain-containing protein [Chitinophagales bacterium]
MISKTTFDFLNELKQNNNKEWFQSNKKRYDAIKVELLAFLQDWINELAKIDTQYASIDPKKCMFRINRDVRFSNDKSPYKTNIGLYVVKGGKNSENGGFYLHIEPNNCFFGGGKYDPSPENLANIRQEIDYNFAEFKSILNAKEFKKYFVNLSEENKLKRKPKDYEDSNPAIEFLKLKNFVAMSSISDEMITDKKLLSEIVKRSNALQPLVAFLNRSNE